MRSRWGEAAGQVWWESARGKAGVVEDGADDARDSDVGQDAPVAAALVADQDVDREGAAKQLGPRKPVMPGRRGWSGRGRGLPAILPRCAKGELTMINKASRTKLMK